MIFETNNNGGGPYRELAHHKRPVIQGGQGRRAEDLDGSAHMLAWMLVATFLNVAGAILWAVLA